jgi:predicted Zn finger-like uncharacterized protein
VKNQSFLSERSATPKSATLPASCPLCKSQDIVTTAKKPSDESYWRCTSCGEVWNNTRRHNPRHSSF